MASTTPVLALRFPDPPDSVDVPRDIKNLALDVDTRIGPIPGQIGNMARVDLVNAAALTLAAGWSFGGAWGYRWPALKLAVVTFQVNRTGATITASNFGHIVDTAIGTVVASLLPAVGAVAQLRTELYGGGCSLEPNGTIIATDLYPSTTIDQGKWCHGTFVYPTAA